MSFTDFDAIRVAGVPLYPPGVDVSGKQYFVAGNYGSDGNDGLSWDSAFKTLAAAIAVNNTNIGASSRGWAARNTMFISGDYFDEDLVAFPNKCDVIGVGSYDGNTMPGIVGNHAPVNAQNWATRFFNVRFEGPAVAAPLITLASTSGGTQFVKCWLHAHTSTTTGITATATPIKVIDCDFDGAFATAYISMGAGQAGGTRILNNRMVDAAAVGILVDSGMTSAWSSIISGNLIEAGTITIDDNSDLFYIVNNQLISLATVVTIATPANASMCDINILKAVGNYFTAATTTNVLFPLADATT